VARILCVGIATLDIVSRLDRYPPEDAEVRAKAQDWRCGGNAANTAVVLAQLGDAVAWAGNLGEDPASDLIRRTFDRFGVDHRHAHRVPGGQAPVSCVWLSDAGGSRTIVHHRDLPEYAAADFATLPLAGLDRVHFEGRAVDQLDPMLQRVRAAGLPVSLEVEKPRPGIEALFGEADLLFFSGDYLRARGEPDPVAFLQGLPPGILATCTRGAAGAWLRDAAGRVHHRPAWRPSQVVDPLGAGDVFNAGMLHALAAGRPPPEALAFANRLAGEQCAREGLELNDG